MLYKVKEVFQGKRHPGDGRGGPPCVPAARWIPPMGMLALILLVAVALGQASCDSATERCPADMLARFRELHPGAEIVQCEGLRTPVSQTVPGKLHQEVRFNLLFRYPPLDEVKEQIWFYGVREDGKLVRHGDGREILHLRRMKCPLQMLARFAAESPLAEVQRCEGLRTGSRSDGKHEEIKFFLMYRNPPDGTSKKETWTYRLLQDGELELVNRARRESRAR